ncbi:MAG TPA: acetoin utilization AcuC family protein [Candidatus Sulfomarinibacteraceae bacterium]|nr:acetoin utilization AcuC family protein [Candidatus Sulfomarinibacteraceae bacterium]
MTDSTGRPAQSAGGRTRADSRPVLVFGPWSGRYDFGPGHPLTPRRFGPGIDLVRAVNDLAGGAPIRALEPEPARDEELRWVHAATYLEAVRRCSEVSAGCHAAGIGPGDTPAFAGMHEAAAAVAGGSIGAAEAILRGETSHAFHPGGGLHHAMPDRASGFCVYNDPALAIARARHDGLRVLYVDLDVHHGDGVQAIHADDPGVLTLSIHQSGQTLFPGTGSIAEVGEGAAAGTSLNVPLDPGSGERAWLAALQAVLPEVAATFGPDLVVSQHGADAHTWDPLAQLRVTTTAMGSAARLVDTIAHRWAGGRWLATGGGGYDVYRVVPRVWSLVWLAASHLEAPPNVPAAWRDRWAADAERYGQAPLPERLFDAPNAGLRAGPADDATDHRAAEVAALLREVTVPALVRAAGDLGWWSALDDLEGAGASAGLEPGAPTAGNADGAGVPAGEVSIVDAVDAASWARWRLAGRVLAPADAGAAHALVLEGLRGSHPASVTVVRSGDLVVGAAVSLGGPGGLKRRLLALGVAPALRGRGLGAVLLHRHLAAATVGDGSWETSVTLAERDVFDPLPRVTRAAIARRLLEGAGFDVERATGPVGTADPAAITARRV